MINGTFDWAYEEEFSCRDGFRWSPDGKSIAYWQLDATKVKNFLMIDNTDSLYPYTIPVEYPVAGEDPSPCRVGVVDIATGKTVWMQVPGDSRQHYLPRMEWAAGSQEVVLEQLNRKQNDAKVFLCDAFTGAARQVYEESDSTWIDVKHRYSDDPTGWEWLNGGKDFLWVSEKDGWRHLFRITRDGKKETPAHQRQLRPHQPQGHRRERRLCLFPGLTRQCDPAIPLPRHAGWQGEARACFTGGAERGPTTTISRPSAAYATHNFSNHLYESVSEWVSLPKHTTIKTNEQPGGRRGGGRVQYPVKMFQLTTDDGVTMDGWMIPPGRFRQHQKIPGTLQCLYRTRGHHGKRCGRVGWYAAVCR